MVPNSDRIHAAQAQFFSPGLVDALVERETRLRIDYRQMPQPQGELARAFLRSAAALLDFLYVSAVFVETAHHHGATTLRDVLAHGEAICREAHALTRLHPMKVIEENGTLAEKLSEVGTPSPEDRVPDLATMISGSEAILRVFPEKELVQLATRVGVHEIGAHIQVALDGVRRLIKRNDPWTDQRLHVVGPEYATGRIDVMGAAEVLELSVPDAVAKLEECGYARPLEHIELSEDERTKLFQALRRDRLERSGKPEGSSSAVARDVIATQRIESVDARPWVESKLM